MDLGRLPKHVWWIITPIILFPIGFLITTLGFLVITYTYMLPKATEITIDFPYIKVISGFASKQVAINNDIQKIISETSLSMRQLLNQPVYVSSTGVMSNPKPHKPEIISKINYQLDLLESKKQQLEQINHELLKIEEKVKALPSKKG